MKNVEPRPATLKVLDPLLTAALDARRHAQARFSGFLVGAALEHSSGRVFTGCNVENASYGLTMCAERVAVFKAISEGFSSGFRRIAIAADGPKLTPPCGACRQILWEFCKDFEVMLVNPRGETKSWKMSDLLPEAFDAENLSS